MPRTTHEPWRLRDQERVLAVEADARAGGCLAVDMVVLVDEHAVGAAEPAAERVELPAQLVVAVGPGVASEPALPRPGLLGGRVVAERGGDHGASAWNESLRVAGDLGPARCEPHAREKAALAPVPDVPFGCLVGLGRRGTDCVEAELRTSEGQLSRCHDRIVP